jgi:SPP1 gp7 family putative phage head morphogenesis protein
MRGLYAAPCSGFVQAHPVRDLGPDLAVALHLAGVASDALAAARIVDWVAFSEDSHPPVAVRLRASSRAEARIAALPMATLAPVVLCEGVARGRVALYERRERLLVLSAGEASRAQGVALVAPTGVLVAKALNPRNARDLRVLATQLANQLTPLDFQAAKVGLEQALQRLDVDWRKLTPEGAAKVWAAADATLKGVLKTAHGEMLPSYVQRITVALEDVVQGTKEALHRQFLSRIGTSLEQRDAVAVRQIARQQGWWVRDEWGVRSDRLTRDGAKIVRRGLADGLGRDEIGRDLRRALPDMWQKYGQSYARLNAGMSTARARSFSEVASYQEAGIESYEIVSVIDERTTDICRALDGQIISTNRAAALLQQQMSLAQPEDIRDVAPLCREVDRDGKRYVETAHGAEIAEVTRSGYGVKDDRGQNSYARMGDQLADVSVGMPPYHFNCRTMTVPRVDAPMAMPNKIPVAQPGPAPAAMATGGTAGAAAVRPLDLVTPPSPGAPTAYGTASLLDEALLPQEFGGAGAGYNAWEGEGAFGLRRWSGDPGSAQFAKRYEGGVEPWGRPDVSFADRLDDLMKRPGLLPAGEEAALVDVYWKNPEYAPSGFAGIVSSEVQGEPMVGALLAREDLGAREILVRFKDPQMSEAYAVRVNPALIDSKAVEKYQAKLAEYQKAVAQFGEYSGSAALSKAVVELRAASYDLLASVTQKGAGKWGKNVDDLAKPRFDRVNAGAPPTPPLRRLKPPKAKAPKGKAPITEPVPPAEGPPIPDLKPGRVGAANRPVTPEIWEAHPAIEQSNASAWYGRGGHYSTAATDPKTGEVVGRGAWREVPERKSVGGKVIPDFKRLPLDATDHVVNVEVGSLRFGSAAEGNPAMMELWGDIVEGEMRRGFRGVREYILRDQRGVAHVVRFDGAAWSDYYYKNPEKALRVFDCMGSHCKCWVDLGNGVKRRCTPKALRGFVERGGNAWTNDVRRFYKKAKVDWSQPGLLAGVPVEEQAVRRIEAVHASIRARVDAEVARRKAQYGQEFLTNREMGEIRAIAIRAELDAGVGTTSAAEAARWDAAQGGTAEVRRKAGARSVHFDSEKATAILVPQDRAAGMLDDSLRFASERLVSNLQRRWAPRFANVPNQRRAYQRGAQSYGEEGNIASVVMDFFPIEDLFAGGARPGLVEAKKMSAAARTQYSTLRHEVQHYVDDLGVHREVQAYLRKQSVEDGVPIVNWTTDPNGNKVKEVYLPSSRVIHRYEMRIYGKELTAIEGAKLDVEKFVTRDEFVKALDRVAGHVAEVGEMMSMTAERMVGSADEMALAYEKNPDEVGAYISMMRGHFVP